VTLARVKLEVMQAQLVGSPQSGRHHPSERMLSNMQENYLAALDLVHDLKHAHEIEHQWEPGMPEWDDAVKHSSLQNYHHAVDHLELLLIEHPMELEKANLSGTGESLPLYSP
jgi:hypothetical protein